ncbi:hypothetical protein K4A83_06880 [Spirulina subsalsa FACHB-351]|uniref:Uncharacterized protein n=1 Tax=Spirulina subsalsa FACHB-351 TaxID=234711 RepID=A0ABT3L3B2_9CYAN|nr:hypothetical protein [Spirulina subsalsa]MCW6035996.1 hypothetical protein [Spirulina subsalsa FACHB-351]
MSPSASAIAEGIRFIPAPPPTDPSIPPSIFGIELEGDRDVEWQWLNLPNGHRVVTGYRVVQRRR